MPCYCLRTCGPGKYQPFCLWGESDVPTYGNRGGNQIDTAFRVRIEYWACCLHELKMAHDIAGPALSQSDDDTVLVDDTDLVPLFVAEGIEIFEVGEFGPAGISYDDVDAA